MNNAKRIVGKFGGQTELSKLIGKRQSTVQYWVKSGTIPAKWQRILLDIAQENHINLSPSDFVIVNNNLDKDPGIINKEPEARYYGELTLGTNTVDCYVLETSERVISLSATVSAITGRTGANLGEYIGVQPLKPYINKDIVLGETINFKIQGNPTLGKGITVETFLDICKAYVTAFSKEELKTNRQREIAIKCSILLSACAKVGLIALIDEATGYQYDREQDALQFKMKLYIADEMRPWEKAFPDELWVEFGRLTNWKGPIHSRPKWWGKLVNELVYSYLDIDVYEWLINNAPKPKGGMNYHQWLTSQYGLKKLIEHLWMLIGMARSCITMRELRERMAIQYGRQNIQLNLFIPTPGNKPVIDMSGWRK